MLKLRNLIEPLSFASVGAAATFCHFAVYFSLLHLMTHVGANAVAYIIATVLSYLGNRLITFHKYQLLIKNYVIVSLVSLLISSSIAFLLGDVLRFRGLIVFFAIACAGFLFSYVLQKRFSVRAVL